MNFSNLIHTQTQTIETSRARSWLHKNYQRHLADDGSIDTEALAWDTALNKITAEDLAAEFKREMDGE